MANQINELALRLPHPDAVTNAQVSTLLNIVGYMTNILVDRGNDNIPGASKPEGSVLDSAAATFINACNQLDSIICDKSRWGTEFQKTLENRAETIHTTNLEVLKAQRDSTAEVISPHFRYRPNVARDNGQWLAWLGELGSDNVILGMGRSPQEALLNFDAIFKGTVPPYMVDWLLSREQALEEGKSSPPFPKKPNETTVDKKRNRATPNPPRKRKNGEGNSGNPS